MGGNNLRVCHLRQPEKLGEESVEGSLGGTVSFVLFGSETGSHCAALTARNSLTLETRLVSDWQ